MNEQAQELYNDLAQRVFSRLLAATAPLCDPNTPGDLELRAVSIIAERDSLRERYEKAMRALESLTPSGSEFVDDPEACVAFKKQADSLREQVRQMREALEAATKVVRISGYGMPVGHPTEAVLAKCEAALAQKEGQS